MPDPRFVLAVYRDDTFMCEMDLTGVEADEVRAAWGLEPGDYPGDCLRVDEDHLDWLAARGLSADLETYDYFVEIKETT